MDVNAGPICRLCLGICESFQFIEDAPKSMLTFVLPVLDSTVSHEPVMCPGCTDDLKKCFEFKAACFHKRDLILDVHEDLKFHPSVVYLKENVTLALKNSTKDAVCCICMHRIDSSACLGDGESLLKSALEVYLPEIDLKFNENSLVCTLCRNSLQNHMTFINNCLETEKEIKKYCEVEGMNNKGQVDLRDVLSIVFEDKSWLNANSNFTLIKTEEECEQVDNKSIIEVEGVEIVKVEEPQLGCTENQDTLNKLESTDTDRRNRSSPTQSASTTVFRDDEVVYKCEECLFYTGFKALLEEHRVAHQKILKITKIFKCGICGYKCTYRQKFHKHALLHKSSKKTYQCERCSFLALSKNNLSVHIQTHGTPTDESTSDSKRFKCDICSFQSNRKYSLFVHSLGHKNDAWTFKCMECSFSTLTKAQLTVHLGTHHRNKGNDNEEGVNKWEIRTYQPKHKRQLPKLAKELQ